MVVATDVARGDHSERYRAWVGVRFVSPPMSRMTTLNQSKLTQNRRMHKVHWALQKILMKSEK